MYNIYRVFRHKLAFFCSDPACIAFKMAGASIAIIIHILQIARLLKSLCVILRDL